jgi:hypothetical protein
MPTKKNVIKQRQRQSVVVNVNVAKARARASAKKSGKSRGYGGGGGGGGGAGGSVSVQMPPQIYASPLDRLTPAMYGSQGQQIQQKSMDDLLRNFLSNQQNQQANTGFRSLGGEPQLRSKSEFIPYDDSSEKSFKSLGSAQSSYYPGSSSVSYNPSSASSLSSQFSDNVSEMTDPSYMSEYEFPQNNNSELKAKIERNNSRIERINNAKSDESLDAISDVSSIPSPFQNEERSYLSASEPDYESTAPKFSQNESRVSQGNIYESIKNIEPAAIDRSSKHFYDMLNRMEEKTQKEIDKLTPQIPEPFRRPDRRPPKRIELDEESILTGTPASKVNIIPFEDDMSSSTFSSDSLNTLNPYPKNIFNKMMGFN